MPPSIAVLIPCHEDCEKAQRLQESLLFQTEIPELIRIIHNGCKRGDAFDFANKARAINAVAPLISSDFIVILDADVELAPTFIDSLGLQIQKDSLDAGSGLVWFTEENPELQPYFSADWYNNGGAMFVATNLLVEQPLSESCVVEDTEYGLRLRKFHYNLARVESATAYTKSYFRDEKIITTLKRGTRYILGSLQLSVRGYASRPESGAIVLVPTAFMIVAVFLFEMIKWWPLSLVGLAYSIVLSLWGFIFWPKNRLLRVLAVFIAVRCIAPFIALTLFVTKKRIW